MSYLNIWSIAFIILFQSLTVNINAQEKVHPNDKLKVIVLISYGYNGSYRVYDHRSYANFKIKNFREIRSSSFYYKLPKEIKDGDPINIAIKKKNFFGKYVYTNIDVSYESDRKYLILHMNIGNKKSHPFDVRWSNRHALMTPYDIWDYGVPGTLVFTEGK